MEQTGAERVEEEWGLQDTGAPGFKAVTTFRWDTDVKSADYFFLAIPGEMWHPNNLLPYHRDRLLAAVEAFRWFDAFKALQGEDGLNNLLDAVIDHCKGPLVSGSQYLRLRVSVTKAGLITVDSTPIPPGYTKFIPKSLDTDREAVLFMPPGCKVFLDTQWTLPTQFSTHKTNFRRPYDDARERCNISNKNPFCAEVLLKNFSDEIMEASCCTAYFLREGRWVTPPLSSGGTAGVTRRMALEQKLCVEAVVKVSEIRHGEIIWLSNGVRGFFEGRLVFVKIESKPEEGQED